MDQPQLITVFPTAHPLSDAPAPLIPQGWFSIDTYPKNGDVVEVLLLSETNHIDLDDPNKNELYFSTIGFNNFNINKNEDRWFVIGYDWANDEFKTIHTVPIAWRTRSVHHCQNLKGE